MSSAMPVKQVNRLCELNDDQVRKTLLDASSALDRREKLEQRIADDRAHSPEKTQQRLLNALAWLIVAMASGAMAIIFAVAEQMEDAQPCAWVFGIVAVAALIAALAKLQALSSEGSSLNGDAQHGEEARIALRKLEDQQRGIFRLIPQWYRDPSVLRELRSRLPQGEGFHLGQASIDYDSACHAATISGLQSQQEQERDREAEYLQKTRTLELVDLVEVQRLFSAQNTLYSQVQQENRSLRDTIAAHGVDPERVLTGEIS